MKITTTFDVVADGKQYELRVEDDSRARCFELTNGEQGTEVAATLNFSGWLWRQHPKKCIAAEALRLVAVELQPLAIPSDLEGSPADTEIVFRDACNQYDIITTAGRARKLVQEAIERRSRGVVNLYEAAAMLALKDGGHLPDYVSMLQDAALDGHLELVSDDMPMRAIDTKARAEFLEKNGLVNKGYVTAFLVTTPAGINRCLDRVDTLGVIARLPNAPPTTSQVGQEELPKMATSESTDDRRLRRLRELKNSGGRCTEVDGVWRITAARGFIASMAKREKSDGRPMSDASDLRKDIRLAAQKESGKVSGTKGSSAFNP